MKKEISKKVEPSAKGTAEADSQIQQSASSSPGNRRHENLPQMANQLLSELDQCSPIDIGDKISEIATVVKINRSCEWIMIGACVLSLTEGSRQTGGRGRTDLEETGCVNIYKSCSEIFDLDWKVVAEHCSLYQKFFINRLPQDADSETVHLKRTELINQAVSLGKTFYRIAAKCIRPLEAIDYAFAQVAKNSKYTTKQFEIDLLGLKWLPIPPAKQGEFIPQSGEPTTDLINIKFTLQYHVIEMIAELAEQQSLSQEAIISEAIKLYSENLKLKGED